MDRRKKVVAYIKSSILLLILIGLPVLLFVFYRDTLLSREWLSRLPSIIQQYRGHTAAILFGIQVLQVIICIIPGQPIQFAGSYLFGIAGGYLISIAGAITGSLISFYAGKLLGKDALRILFDEDKLTSYQNRLNSGKGLVAVLLIYLIPGIPKDLCGYAAGISSMRVRPYLIVSTIGRTPAMLGSLFFGYFFSRNNYTAIAILAIVTVIILVICLIKRRSLVALLDDLERLDQKRHPEAK